MKLHYHPLSSYSRKAAIGIGLRGDPVPLVTVDAFAGGLKTPAYLQLNPFGKMPVLELEDGSAIFESTSILEYLEERGPRVLLPPGQERQARHFDRLGDLYLLDPIGKFFWNKQPEVRTATEATMGKAFGVWQAALADGRSFVCGPAITLGDLAAAVALHYAQTEGLEVPDFMAAYRERLFATPVLQASSAAAMPFVAATLPRRQPA
ncbi:MAG: glutathione S-transferase family protein [Deltaproteobacteria bacterium]|nr:glutathione S-transferase family protein [Deltaproteobacteria bacterium]